MSLSLFYHYKDLDNLICYPLQELEKVKEKIIDLEYLLIALETIQHYHNRKLIMID